MRSTSRLLALSASLMLLSGQASAGDHAEGERLYNIKCSYCHSLSRRTEAARTDPESGLDIVRRAEQRRPGLSEGPPPAAIFPVARRGPHFEDLFRRPPGAARDFAYRMVYEIEGPVWTEADLDAWIAFHARIEKHERADIIAYLKRATRRR